MSCPFDVVRRTRKGCCMTLCFKTKIPSTTRRKPNVGFILNPFPCLPFTHMVKFFFLFFRYRLTKPPHKFVGFALLFSLDGMICFPWLGKSFETQDIVTLKGTPGMLKTIFLYYVSNPLINKFN